MKEKQKKKTVSVREASIVLLIIVAAIATGVIGLKISPNITILFVIALILGYAMFRKVPLIKCIKGLLMLEARDYSNFYFHFSGCIDCRLDSSRNYSNDYGFWF